MAKYDGLANHLERVEDLSVTLDFAEVDELVRGLPPSARKLRTWWGNSRRQSQSKAWLGAGWRVDTVNLTSERVTFARAVAGHGGTVARRAVAPMERPEPEGQAGSLELSTRATWERWGSVTLDERGRPHFPDVPDEPGVYRLWLMDGAQRAGLYIGEGQSLRRRLRNYRSPGAGQQTSLRINGIIVAHLERGGIELDAATRAEVHSAGAWKAADLTRKSDRVLVEHAELVRARNEEACEIHNL